MINTPTTPVPSDQKFGLTLAAACAVLAVYAFARHRTWMLWGLWLLGSVGFGVCTYAAPRALSPLKRVWLRLGEQLGKIVSPVVLGIMFFLIMTPIALLARMFGRDVLHLRPRTTDSYWRAPMRPGAAADSFRNQF
jgi:hypothetical protein